MFCLFSYLGSSDWQSACPGRTHRFAYIVVLEITITGVYLNIKKQKKTERKKAMSGDKKCDEKCGLTGHVLFLCVCGMRTL